MGLAAGAFLGSAMHDALSGPAVAKPYLGQTAELAGVTLAGKKLDVADYRGNVVLVDFWATWCPPCREELPRIRALHERFADQGFRVVGVSLDNNQRDLEAFVKKNKLDWPHIVSDQPDRQSWDSPLVRKYQVRSIPHTLLIDRNGKIVAAGLFGANLEKAIEKLLAGGEKAADALASKQSGAAPSSEALIPFFAVVGCLAGILFERRVREVM